MAQHLQEMEIHLADKVGKTFPKCKYLLKSTNTHLSESTDSSFQSQNNGAISKRVLYSSRWIANLSTSQLFNSFFR